MANTRRSDAGAVVALPWGEFLPWFRDQWRPGEHVALIGPTGTGKSTFAVGILPTRKYVMALDPKGGDSTLAKLRGHGFERVASWPPPRRILRGLEEGAPTRLIVGPVVRTGADAERLEKVLRAALAGAFDQGGWTVYIDELQVATDKRLLNLAAPVERILIAARDKGVSLVSSYQAPRWVPRAAADQSRWLVVWPTRDTDVVNRLAEMAGRPKAELRGAMRALGDNAVLVFSRKPRDPMIVTKAPRV